MFFDSTSRTHAKSWSRIGFGCSGKCTQSVAMPQDHLTILIGSIASPLRISSQLGAHFLIAGQYSLCSGSPEQPSRQSSAHLALLASRGRTCVYSRQWPWDGAPVRASDPQTLQLVEWGR